MTDTLQLNIYGRTGAEPDGSPYGVKLETFLRASNIKYTIVSFPEHQLKTAPKGKCPFVLRSDLNDGKHLGDSAVIMQTLVERGDAPDFDGWLSESERAVATAMRGLLEDNIYWYGLWVKWSTDQYWKVTYPIYFKDAPWFIRPIIGYFARRDTMAQAYAQGTGRHSEEELIVFATEKLKAVSTFLGDKKYMMGERISTLDFTAFGILSNLASEPWEHAILDIVRNDSRLAAYVERMKSEFFADFAESGLEKSKAN